MTNFPTLEFGLVWFDSVCLRFESGWAPFLDRLNFLSGFAAAILDDPMECSRGERLSITLARNRINRAPERAGKAKVEVDIFELLRDSEYETAETSTYISGFGDCLLDSLINWLCHQVDVESYWAYLLLDHLSLTILWVFHFFLKIFLPMWASWLQYMGFPLCVLLHSMNGWLCHCH